MFTHKISFFFLVKIMQVTFSFTRRVSNLLLKKTSYILYKQKDRRYSKSFFFSSLRKIKPSLLSSNILYQSGYKGRKSGAYSLSTITTALLTSGSSGVLKFQPYQVQRTFSPIIVLLNTEYDTRVVPENEISLTVRTTLIFLVILTGSYFQGLELLQTIKDS